MGVKRMLQLKPIKVEDMKPNSKQLYLVEADGFIFTSHALSYPQPGTTTVFDSTRKLCFTAFEIDSVAEIHKE
jgi:hypothetical protein